MKYLPLLQLEVFSTGAGEISFVEVGAFGVLKIAWEVRDSIGKLVALVANEEIIATAECWAKSLEAASCLVFERLHERVLHLISD